ncbi:unnamed protein product [Cylicocyclus nassatus]|uniref:Uncharacterized protein n=1 Tax=Cylicocyclus nassatus TaxID=53992 RepID=A0AA36HBZ9_CYLNA|nr:unnamed protein product [Cylicocyclus nassatus]CAJ0607877.1 unnamed protein product [Cylicocyclus nassatus]
MWMAIVEEVVPSGGSVAMIDWLTWEGEEAVLDTKFDSDGPVFYDGAIIPTFRSTTLELYIYCLIWAALVAAFAISTLALAVSIRHVVRACRTRRWKPVIAVGMPESVDRSFCAERCNERGVCFGLGAGEFKCVCYEADDFSASCNGATTTPSEEAERVNWELIAALVVALVVLMSFLAVCCGFWRRRCRECVDGGIRAVLREAARRCGEASPGPPAGEERREMPA